MANVIKSLTNTFWGNSSRCSRISIIDSDGLSCDVDLLQKIVKSVIPPLTTSLHKGQCGRIGIIGGCQEYTGAPYFAAITAMKFGADLSHIFCTKEAGVVIKSYSPDLIVHPVLDHTNAIDEIECWLPRLHALVIGPGLGRDLKIIQTASAVIEKSKLINMPLVIDADGLFIVTERPDLVMNYSNVVLTPNVIEFERLCSKIGENILSKGGHTEVKQLAQRLGNLTIVKKGATDVITDGSTIILCGMDGSCRRCGGQGDFLSGALAVSFYWALLYSSKQVSQFKFGPGLIAGYMSCHLVRNCNQKAFEVFGRSMVASDMIQHIHSSFDEIFM